MDELREKLEEISRNSPFSHYFILVEINKYVEKEKEELYQSTENLKSKYLPGYTGIQPELVFIRKEGTEWEKVRCHHSCGIS